MMTWFGTKVGGEEGWRGGSSWSEGNGPETRDPLYAVKKGEGRTQGTRGGGGRGGMETELHPRSEKGQMVYEPRDTT